jgi:hypothetical protein
MTFPIGKKCRLRFLPLPEVIPPDFNPSVGGEYVSGVQGVGKPIVVAADVPPIHDSLTVSI